MHHVFVETNWLHDYAAPAHHKVPSALALLQRAQQGEFVLHIPSVSFGEARHSIQAKCQPVDGPGVHRYIRWAHKNGQLDDEQASEAHQLAERYVQAISTELAAVPKIFNDIARLACVRTFALDDEMLDLANHLAFTKAAQKPFDHAILAGILVSSSRLWKEGERGISFAEIDSDLQPWGPQGAPKDDLRTLYDAAHVWVFGDFTLQFPPRPTGFE
jgi:hypothetical protein